MHNTVYDRAPVKHLAISLLRRQNEHRAGQQSTDRARLQLSAVTHALGTW